MPSSSVPKPWRVADVTFVEIEIRHPSERQMRVEFGCGVSAQQNPSIQD